MDQAVTADILALPLHRVRLTLAFERECTLPPYPGSALRGLLGHGLRRTLCVTRRTACEGCTLQARCGYARFFESPATGAAHRQRYAATPHAWVLHLHLPTPPRLARGESLAFDLVLMGDAGKALPWLAPAMRHAGMLGLGRDRTPFRLVTMERETPVGSAEWEPLDTSRPLPASASGIPRPPAPRRHMRILLETPLRLKRRGRLLGPRDFSNRIFLDALRLRMRDLLALYGLAQPRLPDLPERLRPGPAPERLAWKDWTRYSSRQRTRMQMGGIVGEFTLDLDGLEAWWPLVWLGQWIHVGKQTSMGLGQYRLDTSL